MRANRSVPPSSVIPVLAYADVPAAGDWLCKAFGFRERLLFGEHRAQLVYGDGAVILTELRGEPTSCSVHVRVDDAAAHHDQAKQCGAQITSKPADHPYGERQYTALDLGGHHWTFSESIADVDPISWGAIPCSSRGPDLGWRLHRKVPPGPTFPLLRCRRAIGSGLLPRMKVWRPTRDGTQ